MSRTVSAILGIPAMTLVLACGAFASYAQEGELPATDGAFYALSVRNIDKAVAWYTKHLGFKLESQGGNDQRRGALLSRPGAVLELGQFAAAMTYPAKSVSFGERFYNVCSDNKASVRRVVACHPKEAGVMCLGE